MKKILFAASEAAPFAHTGGLGDVMGALPPGLQKEKSDWDVRVVLPLYPGIRERFAGTVEFTGKTCVHLSWRNLYCGVWKTEKDGVTYYFIDNEYYFHRPTPYGAFDDGERFAFFGLAVLELMKMGRIHLVQEKLFDEMQLDTVDVDETEGEAELELSTEEGEEYARIR